MFSNLIFVDIDTQRDFLDPDGALYVPDSASIRPRLAALTLHARKFSIHVLASACAHTPDDAELRDFPPHCMLGTRGQERIPETERPDGVVLDPRASLHADADLPLHLTLQKKEYDVATHPAFDRVVERCRHQVGDPLFVVYGVATDFCVRKAAEALRARDFRVALVVDAIRPIERAGEPEVLRDLVARGVVLTLTDVVLEHPLHLAI